MICIIFTGCNNSPSEKKAKESILGKWVEVRETNKSNSIFNARTGKFFIPSWKTITITDSNYLFIKITDSINHLKYPYAVFNDSILVIGTNKSNDIFLIKKVNSRYLSLVRRFKNDDPYIKDSMIYHFVSDSYYQRLNQSEKGALFKLNKQDTLYVKELIQSIVSPHSDSTDGFWFHYTFTPENDPFAILCNYGIEVSKDSTYSLFSVFNINICNTMYDTVFEYSRIEIDTSGRMYMPDYTDFTGRKLLMDTLFRKYVQDKILWHPATTLGFKHPADIKAIIHYKISPE